MASLPQDVDFARKNRINQEMANFFQRPADPNSPNPLSFKGIGVYTHAVVPVQNHAPISSNQGVAQSKSKTIFLPLGGPMKVGRKRGLQGVLPDDVKSVFEEVRTALAQEENLLGLGEENDARERFGQLALPEQEHSRPPVVVSAAPRPPSPPGLSALAPPPPPPPLDEEYLAARRDSILFSIPTHLLSDQQRSNLKIALNKHGWPSRYASVSAYDAPVQQQIGQWSQVDEKALECILENTDLSAATIASCFFPSRSVGAIHRKKSRLSVMRGLNASNAGVVQGKSGMSGTNDNGEGGSEIGTIESPAVMRRKSIAGKERQHSFSSKSHGTDLRRLSIPATSVDVVMGGTTTETTKQRDTESPVSATAGPANRTTTYDPSRDPRRRGR